jgi:hypothetical protein
LWKFVSGFYPSSFYDELRVLAQEPPALQVSRKPLPGLSDLHLGELEGEEFYAGPILSRLLAMDPQSAQYHLSMESP